MRCVWRLLKCVRNPYKQIVDMRFIVEQAENKNTSVWGFLKGLVDDVIVKEEREAE